MTRKKFDVQASIRAQAEYCEAHGVPHFAPKDGICWRCGKQFYAPHEGRFGQTGHDLYTAAHTHIIGCPHCHKSYCD